MLTTFRLLALLAAATQVLALWPMPRQFTNGTTPLRLSPGFSIEASFGGVPSDLSAAITRTKSFLQNDKLGRLVIDRGASDLSAVRSAKTLSSLKLELNKGGKVESVSSEAVKTLEDRDESYELTIPEGGGAATLKANSSLGLFRGLSTFTQFWWTASGETYTLEAPVSITDSPAFPYRGFMLDTARNFFPVSDIERTIDAMSWVKINTFHWHVSDSQSFPLEVPGFEELAQKGAYFASASTPNVYTASDVSNIISYAAARGIDVVVEIDTPGHTSVISKSHPEHVACAESTPWASFANEPPAGQLRLATPATINFTTSLLTAVGKMFPSTLMSTGGDEVNTNCYAQDGPTQQALNSTGQDLNGALNTFIQSTHGGLKAIGKTPVVWEEMVLSFNITLDPSTVVMVWISSSDVTDVVNKGFRVVHAASNYFYLDCGGGGWVGANPNGNSWCDPFKTWQLAYTFNPFTGVSADQQKLILGGEHLLWTEQSSPSNLDPVVWPRAATSAEIYWTGQTLPDGTNRSTAGRSALPRLHEMALRMQTRGVDAIPLQPLWCALRPGACDVDA